MKKLTRLVTLSWVIASLSSFQVQAADVFTAKAYDTQKSLTILATPKKKTVLVFLSAECPCSGSHEAGLKELYKNYHDQGFEFIAIHSNQNESFEEAQAHFKETALPFPVVRDEGAKIADHFKAIKTPHVYVFSDSKLVYQGGIDDSADASRAKKFYLKNALNELSQNKPVSVASARALGCRIKR